MVLDLVFRIENNKSQVILIVSKLLSFYCFFYLMLNFQDIVKDRKKIGLHGHILEGKYNVIYFCTPNL